MPDDTRDFYRKFEDRFRGSPDKIRHRLEVYLPFLEALATRKRGFEALDLGCGRCEWLDLLSEKGIPCRGVDLDDGMMRACREMGYRVNTKDALDELKSQREESLLAVSGFHIVEHLEFGTLQSLLSEAHRALVPGGVLILETPNPENIVVGTSNFFLDPTHLKPIPQALLSYLVESAGFKRLTTLRLQEVDYPPDAPDVGGLFWGVGFDYSVVAQKAGDEETIAALDELFSAKKGVSLEDAVSRYNTSLERWAQSWVARLVESWVESRVESIVDVAVRKSSAQLRSILEGPLNEIRNLAQRTRESDDQIRAMMDSWSWKATTPLRFLVRSAKSAVKRAAKIFLATFGRLLFHIPFVRALVRRLLGSRPELLSRVLRKVSPNSSSEVGSDVQEPALPPLSPIEQDIFAKLTETQKKGKKL